MEEKEENKRPRNIFEEASRSRVARKLVRKEDVKDRVDKSQVIESEVVKPTTQVKIPDEEVVVMFSKMEVMRRELEEKMGEIINLAGVSKDEATTFLDNPDNFSPAEWEKVLEKKDELTKMVTQITGKVSEKRKVVKKEEIETKKLRQKSLGGRKKWIPMR